MRSFAQRSVRTTPRKADPQPAREAVCGRPGKHAPATSAAMPSARASEEQRVEADRHTRDKTPFSKVISSNECTGAQRMDESGAPSARIPGQGFEVAPTLGPPIKGTATEDALCAAEASS